MKKTLGYTTAAAIAIMLYATGTHPVWQMIYTVGIIVIVAATPEQKTASE